MTWEIRVSHEPIDGRTRVTIEASDHIPEDVIAEIAAAYWGEEVRFVEEWDGEEYDEGNLGPGGIHG